MLSWVCVNSPSIDLFSYRTPGHGQKGHIRSVRTSVQIFFGTGYLVFSGIQHGVRGPFGVVHDRARFFENHIFPPKWGK